MNLSKIFRKAEPVALGEFIIMNENGHNNDGETMVVTEENLSLVTQLFEKALADGKLCVTETDGEFNQVTELPTEQEKFVVVVLPAFMGG